MGDREGRTCSKSGLSRTALYPVSLDPCISSPTIECFWSYDVIIKNIL